jgi:hypothetical protein
MIENGTGSVIKNENSHRTRNSIQGIMRNGNRFEIGNRKGTGMRTTAGTQTGTGEQEKRNSIRLENSYRQEHQNNYKINKKNNRHFKGTASEV